MTRTSTIARSEPGPRELLNAAGTDAVGNAVLSLAAELWAVCDRVRVLEAVLETKGIDVHDAINRFVPSPDLDRELDARRDKLINAVVAALSGEVA